jgi:hypothetical protein
MPLSGNATCGERKGNQMTNGNVIQKVLKNNDNDRFRVYYDNKPATAAEMDNRVCLTLKSSGQVIRFNEGEALDLIAGLTKALKWKHNRSHRF